MHLVAKELVAVVCEPERRGGAPTVRVVQPRELPVRLGHVVAAGVLLQSKPLKGRQRLQAELVQREASRRQPAQRPAAVDRRVADARKPAAEVGEPPARSCLRGRRR